MTNLAFLLMAFSATSLVSPGLSQDPTTTTKAPALPLEASNDSDESSSTSQEDKEVGSNRILNYGENQAVGSGFGLFPESPGEILPTLEYPIQSSQYPSYKPYLPLGQGYGGHTQHKYHNIGCKHYCPGFYPGSFYCCNKSPSYGGYYCPRVRQSCPASSRHRAPRPCVEDRDCYHGQRCCLDACLRYHVCKATDWL